MKIYIISNYTPQKENNALRIGMCLFSIISFALKEKLMCIFTVFYGGYAKLALKICVCSKCFV
jgi:hypothetical protein